MDDGAQTEMRGELRRKALAARKRLPAAERRRRSEMLCGQLLDLLEATREDAGRTASDCIVAVYAATGSEVELDAFIDAAFERGVGLAFPCMIGDTDSADASATDAVMDMRLVDEQRYRDGEVPFVNDPLKSLAADSPRLAPYPSVAPSDPILIVVPLVAFDASGNRLGYGAGNYDRYLAQTDPSCRIVGVAFAEQEVERIPTLPHDRPLTVFSS